MRGPYNYFENVYFNGMNAARSEQQATTSFCLSVTGAENYFKNCTIGSVQTVLPSTNAVLISPTGPTPSRAAASSTTGRLPELPGQLCRWYGRYEPHSVQGLHLLQPDRELGRRFDRRVQHRPDRIHYVLLKDCSLVGGNGTISWADVVTHVYHDKAAPATGGGIAIAVNA